MEGPSPVRDERMLYYKLQFFRPCRDLIALAFETQR